jgi:hypothetical protein
MSNLKFEKNNGKLKAKIILNKIYLKTGIDVLKYYPALVENLVKTC